MAGAILKPTSSADEGQLFDKKMPREQEQEVATKSHRSERKVTHVATGYSSMWEQKHLASERVLCSRQG